MKKRAPWNIKPGMKMRVGVTPDSSDMLEVVEVEKGRGKVTGARVYRVTVKVPACYPPFVSGYMQTVLIWPDERREVTF